MPFSNYSQCYWEKYNKTPNNKFIFVFSPYVLCCASSCPTICDPMNCSPPVSSVHGKWLPHPPPGYLLIPGVKPKFPTLQENYLLSKPPGKPKSTGVGGLSLLQQIFLTQELNRGLLHCWATREALFTLYFSTIFISKLFYCVHAIAKYFILFVNFAVSNVLP